MPKVLPGRRPPRALVVQKPRTSPRERGYSSRWDRASEQHRRKHPFCIWCEQEGRLEFAKVVDHKIPIADGGAMFDPSNWWGLCIRHHGLKGSMEIHARQIGQLDRLPLWCDDPSARPARFNSGSPSR